MFKLKYDYAVLQHSLFSEEKKLGSVWNHTPLDFTNPILATKGLGFELVLTPTEPLGLGLG